jgi:hypothetical protein
LKHAKERSYRDKRNILEAMLAVARGVTAVVGHDRQNVDDGYSYASNERVVTTVRQAMLDNSILCLPVSSKGTLEDIHVQDAASGGERVIFSALLEEEFDFVHVPSQEHLTVVILGAGQDLGEKGVYKAHTGAEKYALRETFLLSTTDDAERDRAALVLAAVAVSDAKGPVQESTPPVADGAARGGGSSAKTAAHEPPKPDRVARVKKGQADQQARLAKKLGAQVPAMATVQQVPAAEGQETVHTASIAASSEPVGANADLPPVETADSQRQEPVQAPLANAEQPLPSSASAAEEQLALGEQTPQTPQTPQAPQGQAQGLGEIPSDMAVAIARLEEKGLVRVELDQVPKGRSTYAVDGARVVARAFMAQVFRDLEFHPSAGGLTFERDFSA